jgi:SAM-dependent methyltransferase
MKIGKIVFLGRKTLQYYNGLLIKADLGLHDQIAKVLKEKLQTGASILDFGAGEGALSARLQDNGFCVTAADKDIDSFKCKEIFFSRVDFDIPSEVDAFTSANENAFDAVIGVEVIEHVQDQWKYAKQLMTMVKPGGLVLVSTPNTTSWLSRTIFFLTGKFHQFSDSDLHYGHISPVTTWELFLILKNAGGNEIAVRPAGTLPPIFLTGFNIISVLSILTLPFRLIMRGNINGWCVIATARKKA